MNSQQPTEQRLAEIRAALKYSDWHRFDRDDVTMLVNEIDRLRTELRARYRVDEKSEVNL